MNRLHILTLMAGALWQGHPIYAQSDSVRIARSLTMEEVVVTGSRSETDVRHLPMTVSIVNRSQIEQAHTPSILPLLNEQIPGLFSTSRGVMGYGVSTGAAGSLSLRGIGGAPTTSLLVLIDGHPQYMGLMGHPIADAYQSMWTERVEVVRGPASVLYGSNAMGGVINLITRKPQKDGTQTSIHVGGGSYGTFLSEITNQVRKGKFSTTVSASYNHSDGHRPNMGFEQYGGYAKLQYSLSTHWNAYADCNATHFNASNPGPVSAPLTDNDSRITRGMASVSLQNNYRQTSGNLGFFYNWGRHKINDGYHTGESPQSMLFNSKDRMMGISWYQNISFFEGNRTTFGADYQHFGGESWYKVISTGEKQPQTDKKEDEFAGYIDISQEIGACVSLNAGLRVDHHSHAGTELVPQGGIALHLPRNTELKLMASKGFRNPTIREMYMFPPQNPDLKPERLMNYELSFAKRKQSGKPDYGINLYYIKGDNIITAVQTEGRPRNMNSGRIRNWGAEMYAGFPIGRSWQINANYSRLHMKHPVTAAPEHKLYTGLLFAKRNWRVSGGMQYIKGLYTSVILNGQGSETKENFVLLSLNADYRLSKYISLYLKGENLLAQQYETLAGYPMPKATCTGGIRIDL